MSATIRQVESAVSLVIRGAIESKDFGPEQTLDKYERQVFKAVARTLADWLEDDPDIAFVCAKLLTQRHETDTLVEADAGYDEKVIDVLSNQLCRLFESNPELAAKIVSEHFIRFASPKAL